MLTFGSAPFEIIECNSTGKTHKLQRAVRSLSDGENLLTECGIYGTVKSLRKSGYGWNICGKEFKVTCKKCATFA